MPDRPGPSLVIAPASVQDAEGISRLILALRHSFLLDAQGVGAEAFLQALSPSAIAQLIDAQNMRYLKAMHGDQLVGVVAVRDGTHLYHLFVDTLFQGKGLGRMLWEYILSAERHQESVRAFTVNSSVSAVPIYERFGFRVTGARTETKGIAFIPMRRDPEAVPGA